MDCRTLGFLSFILCPSFLKYISFESVMLSNYLILCCPLLLLPSIFPRIRVFSKESVLCFRWPKYWNFSFSISSSNEYSGLISFRIDWFDLLAVQGTLKSLLLHHSSKASILWHSAFFMVQLSHPYMTTGKTIALTRWTFIGKVMSLLFNTLSRFARTFLPRSVFEFHSCSHCLQWYGVSHVGDQGSILGLGKSLGEGNGNPLQYSCLENPMDRGTWWAAVHGVAKELDMT